MEPMLECEVPGKSHEQTLPNLDDQESLNNIYRHVDSLSPLSKSSSEPDDQLSPLDPGRSSASDNTVIDEDPLDRAHNDECESGDSNESKLNCINDNEPIEPGE